MNDDQLTAVLEMFAAWRRDEDAEWHRQCAQHRDEWAGLQPCPEPFFTRRARAWQAIAEAYAGASYDGPLTFPERRRRIAEARYRQAAYELDAKLWGVDFTDATDADFDILRDALAEFSAVVARHGWAVGLATTGKAAA